MDRLHRQGIDVSTEAAQLPISGMASTPSLAFRYNVAEDNKVNLIMDVCLICSDGTEGPSHPDQIRIA